MCHFFEILCFMGGGRGGVRECVYHVSCSLCHVSCSLCHVSCSLCHVSCSLCHVSCSLCHVSCSSLLLCFQLTGADAQKLAMAVVRVMQAILSGSPNAKVSHSLTYTPMYCVPLCVCVCVCGGGGCCMCACVCE